MDQKSLLKLDLGNIFADAVGAEHGVSPAEFDALSGPVADFTRDIQRRRQNGEVGFMDLPYDSALAEDVESRAGELSSWCENFVVLGIGGSALGNITVRDALGHSLKKQTRSCRSAGRNSPDIFILDNIDPVLISEFFDFIAPQLSRTAFNVITKSGSTAETMSQFLHVRELLARTGGCSSEKQIILTTDPDAERSLLRRIGDSGGYCMYPIPENVGGRFSVLSAVGLLSAAVGGCDIKELLLGAAAMDARCSSPEMYKNPAALYACALYKHYLRDKTVDVIMPYSHHLQSLALWYCQLWAESLGKRDGLKEKNIFTGPTPIASTGVTDQHSVMQLYQDGPFDKVITFIEVDCCRRERVPICENDVEPDLRYLSGKSFNELFQAELTATRCALRDKQRPNCTIKLPEVSARTLGELFMFFEYAVTYSGCLYGVDAFDQPGVELGKKYTYGLMGRNGFMPPALD